MSAKIGNMDKIPNNSKIVENVKIVKASNNSLLGEVL